MRLQNSNLKEDLFDRNMETSPMCACNTEIEDAEHYLITCPNYEEQRNWIQDTLGWDIFDLDVEELLFGSNKLSEKENEVLFDAVQHYIKITKRVVQA